MVLELINDLCMYVHVSKLGKGFRMVVWFTLQSTRLPLSRSDKLTVDLCCIPVCCRTQTNASLFVQNKQNCLTAAFQAINMIFPASVPVPTSQ